MAALTQYLVDNKERAYDFASKNTKYDEQNRPTVSIHDEWVSENEWEDLFSLLKREKQMGK